MFLVGFRYGVSAFIFWVFFGVRVLFFWLPPLAVVNKTTSEMSLRFLLLAEKGNSRVFCLPSPRVVGSTRTIVVHVVVVYATTRYVRNENDMEVYQE